MSTAGNLPIDNCFERSLLTMRMSCRPK